MEGEKQDILVIDDEEINRVILENIFAPEYTVLEAKDGREGLRIIEQKGANLAAVLLDVIMPQMDGIQLLRHMREAGWVETIPVFLITADTANETMHEAYRLGVMDVISKPVIPFVVQRRVNSVVELFRARRYLSRQVESQKDALLQKTRELAELSMGMVEALATAIEFRSDESGKHVRRIHDITCELLYNTPLGKDFSDEQIKMIGIASITHDVGKISIPDAILNKPGRLTPEEYELMKQHTVQGAHLLASIPQMKQHAAYPYAYDIALHHHERWDGKGYPEGLVGAQTPIWSQIVALADVYDALVSERCYKGAYSAPVAVQMIREGKCGAFNPELLYWFEKQEPKLRKMYQEGEQENPNV